MGRPKGAKNKHSIDVDLMAMQYKLQPFEFMMAVINNDFKKLGYESATKTTFTPQGIEVEEDHITVKDRVKCAEAASKYLYTAKKALEVSSGEQGFKVIIEDYSKDKK